MKDKVFKYKGQLGSVEPDLSRGYMYGKLLYINDLIAYEAATIPELEKEFQAAVDEYLEDCADLGVEPNKPFKGGFNVRVGEDLHRQMVFEAAERGVSLNEACVQAFKAYVCETELPKVEHVHNHTHVHFETKHEFDYEFKPDAVEAENRWSVNKGKTHLRAVN